MLEIEGIGGTQSGVQMKTYVDNKVEESDCSEIMKDTYVQNQYCVL